MATKTAHDFIEQISNDTKNSQKLNDLSVEFSEKAITIALEIAKQNGFDISKDDLKEALAEKSTSLSGNKSGCLMLWSDCTIAAT